VFNRRPILAIPAASADNDLGVLPRWSVRDLEAAGPPLVVEAAFPEPEQAVGIEYVVGHQEGEADDGDGDGSYISFRYLSAKGILLARARTSYLP
jgi:hypothetical protein